MEVLYENSWLSLEILIVTYTAMNVNANSLSFIISLGYTLIFGIPRSKNKEK